MPTHTSGEANMDVFGWDIDWTMHPGSLFVELLTHSVEHDIVSAQEFDLSNLQFGVVARFINSIQGLSPIDFSEFTSELTERAPSMIYPWVAERQQQQAEHGDVILLSQGPDFVVDAFALGLPWVKWARGSEYTTGTDGRFTGSTTDADKLVLARWFLGDQQGRVLTEMYGDSGPDVAVLEEAQRAFLVDTGNDNDAILEVARGAGWTILDTAGSPTPT